MTKTLNYINLKLKIKFVFQDVSAVEIVEKSLELFSILVSTVRQSTRAGGHILQNITMMGKA